MSLMKFKTQFNVKNTTKVSQTGLSKLPHHSYQGSLVIIILILHHNRPWAISTGGKNHKRTITYKSVVEADITFQLRPSMLKLDNWNFCCSDRQYIVHQIFAFLQSACKCFNYVDTVQALYIRSKQ